jgi:mono/diheme cytochrome c family protein
MLALSTLSIFLALVGCSAKPDVSDARGNSASGRSSTAERIAKPASGTELYAQHCAACHGATGDGRGSAAVFVFPRPRDFRAGRWRLTSTVNGIPSRDDIEAVLTRGMPGSAMVSWAHLPAADRRALAEHVLQLRREGARDIELKLAAEAEEELTKEQLAEAVARATTPGEVFEPPSIGPASAESIARGKAIYLAKGCAGCHGDTGKGDGQQKMVDAEGLPTRPRDLTLGIFKGNHDPQSVYRRIWLGMPGSPMPASQQLTPEEVTDLVHFSLSLSSEEQREAAVLKHCELTAKRTQALPGGPEDSGWSDAQRAEVRTTPLWWRDAFARELTVEALHDGTTLALRISWDDPTHDDAATRPDQFEDMVAIELTTGPNEPFLGMGAADAPAIDLWQWRAGARATGAEDELSDDYPFDTAVYREHAGDKPLPDFVTARAVGNPLATRAHDGAHLAAKGFGTLTFLPKASQVVSTEGVWKDGRWMVTLRRPLVLASEEGQLLEPGRRYSVAFAIWDGSAHDRGPQKLITLWNDLRIE